MEKRRTDFDLWAPAVTGTLFPVLSDCQGCAMSYVHTPGRGVVWRGEGRWVSKGEKNGLWRQARYIYHYWVCSCSRIQVWSIRPCPRNFLFLFTVWLPGMHYFLFSLMNLFLIKAFSPPWALWIQQQLAKISFSLVIRTHGLVLKMFSFWIWRETNFPHPIFQ